MRKTAQIQSLLTLVVATTTLGCSLSLDFDEVSKGGGKRAASSAAVAEDDAGMSALLCSPFTDLGPILPNQAEGCAGHPPPCSIWRCYGPEVELPDVALWWGHTLTDASWACTYWRPKICGDGSCVPTCIGYYPSSE